MSYSLRRFLERMKAKIETIEEVKREFPPYRAILEKIAWGEHLIPFEELLGRIEGIALEVERVMKDFAYPYQFEPGIVENKESLIKAAEEETKTVTPIYTSRETLTRLILTLIEEKLSPLEQSISLLENVHETALLRRAPPAPSFQVKKLRRAISALREEKYIPRDSLVKWSRLVFGEEGREEEFIRLLEKVGMKIEKKNSIYIVE